LKLRRLSHLSTDYKFAVGSCWGGSPRFEAWVTDGTSKWKIFFFIGPPPSGSGYQPYSEVQARYGNYTVTAVYLDVDGGWQSNQTVDFDNTVVNQNLVTYEG
jgi:hypothetical protein